MAKGKDKKEPIVNASVDNHGQCADCHKVVDVVVDPFQVTGNNTFVCVPCRGKRILSKAVEDKAKTDDKARMAIERLNADADDARQNNRQGALEFPVGEDE